MTGIEKLYTEVLNATKRRFKGKHFLEDAVNAGYIQLIESGSEIDFSKWMVAIKTVLLEGLNKSEISYELIEKIQTKFCKCCQEDKPISAFGIAQRKGGKRVIQTYCHDCIRLKMADYRKKNPEKFRASLYKYFKSEKGKAAIKKTTSSESSKKRIKEYHKKYNQSEKFKKYKHEYDIQDKVKARKRELYKNKKKDRNV